MLQDHIGGGRDSGGRDPDGPYILTAWRQLVRWRSLTGWRIGRWVSEIGGRDDLALILCVGRIDLLTET